MDVINAILKPVVDSLMIPVKRYLGYMVSSTKYVRDMHIKMAELDAAKHSVEEHRDHNILKNFKIPSQVIVWLEEVGNIKAKGESIPSDVGSCFNFKIRHKIGREAFEIIEEIESVKRKHSLINWTDDPIPLAKVDSMKAYTSTRSTDHHDFESREETFMKALKSLEPDHKSHMIALCGMGGVGKTMMMQNLKKVVKEKNMFNFIVEAVIGEKTDPGAIQQAVADYFSVSLNEETKPARAERLRKSFEAHSSGGKNKILVILDDVWEIVDLNDIGLSPLPNQGVDFKVLLTSRDRDVCSRMGVNASSIIDVKLLTDPEAQTLFFRFVKDSEDTDLDSDFKKIGNDIVSRCQGLPIAIKTIACNLRGQRKEVWDDALSRLMHGDIKEIAHNVFEISYNNLKNETKSTFLLCGLYPEDFDIPEEELLRYAWGLKLYNQVHTIRQARNRLSTCIEQLIHANLLIGTHYVKWVKMHDLVRAFVLSMLSEEQHCSVVSHGNMFEWPAEHMSQSCKRLSLTCKDTWKFPRSFKYPNLSFLKLVHGEKLTRQVQDIYGGMENLQVIACQSTYYLSFTKSLQCSSNLRTLCLERCPLTFDCTLIGDLSNLEVLSFAHSGIQKLPSVIGKLNKLKLLDLSYCVNLHVDNGVFENLVNLEELYMRVAGEEHPYWRGGQKAVTFTGGSYNGLAECSKKLSALEIELFENNTRPNYMSFEKLESFVITIGCLLRSMKENLLPFENKLMLVTSKGELLGCRINELFANTHVLYLEVGDINDLEAVDLAFSHHVKTSSFYNLRFLSVSKCSELRYLFTPRVVLALLKLEELQITSCPILETIIHIENCGSETIRLPMLKRLVLRNLPKLLTLCHTANVIELPKLAELDLYMLPKITSIYVKNNLSRSSTPSNISAIQPLLKEVVIPKLDKLSIEYMKSLEEIWSCEIASFENVNMLKDIRVKSCDRLVNLFPINPMSVLLNLNDLEVEKCGSIEVLFNLDLGSVSDHEMEGKSTLRRIKVNKLQKLSEVWRMKGVNNSNLPVRGFEAIESLEIKDCRSFINLFTPTTANFNLGALIHIDIENIGRDKELTENSQEPEIMIQSEEEKVEVRDNILNVAVSSYLMRSCHHLHELLLEGCKGKEAVFEMEVASNREVATTSTKNQQDLLLPYLKRLQLVKMDEMRHVWKYDNWKKLFVLQQQQRPIQSSFHNLLQISLYRCHRIKYLFSPLMLKLLINLKDVRINTCFGIEEVVSNRDDDDKEIATLISTHTKSMLPPFLDNLTLYHLSSLRHIGGGSTNAITSNNVMTNTSIEDKFQNIQLDVAWWSLGQYSRRINILNCDALSSVIPSHAVTRMQNIEELEVQYCNSMIEVFETESANNTSAYAGKGSGAVGATGRRFTDMIAPQLSNIKVVEISGCHRLRYLFTFSTLESLKQLRTLKVKYCKNIHVIVKEEDGADTSKVVVFPCLKSVILADLPNLNGFFPGMNEFRWHLLDAVSIIECPKMARFTRGHSTSPMLKYVSTGFGRYRTECGLNFHKDLQTSLASLDGSSNSSPILKRMPWSSFSNLIEIEFSNIYVTMDYRKVIIPFNELQLLENLEKITVKCHYVEGVFEALESTTTSGANESQKTIIKIPKLREVWLSRLPSLQHIWKSNYQLTVLEFPNLTTLSIDDCDKLEYVFSSSMIGSLLQLQELSITSCRNMEVVVKGEEEIIEKEEEGEEGCDGRVNNNEITNMFPCLKSIRLASLRNLKGFWLGNNDQDLKWPSLVSLGIVYCPEMKVFTNGKSTAPKLKFIDTWDGTFDANQDPNSITKIKKQVAEGFYLGIRHYD